MTYALIIKRQAKNKLESLPKPDRHRVAEKIVMLGKNPEDPKLDVKHLQGEPYHRL